VKLRKSLVALTVIALMSASSGLAEASKGPVRIQRLAAEQTQQLLGYLNAPPLEQTASPRTCRDADNSDKYRKVFLLPTLAGQPGDKTFYCRVNARTVLVDLGGAFVTEDNNPESTWTTAGGEVLRFTRDNLEPICDDIIAGYYSKQKATATVDGKALRGVAVSTPAFISRIPKAAGQLYVDSKEVGHPGKLATTYCGWKAEVPLQPGRHVIVVDLSDVAGARTVFTYEIKVER